MPGVLQNYRTSLLHRFVERLHNLWRVNLAALIFFSFLALAASADEPLKIVGQTTAEPALAVVTGVTNIEVFHAISSGWTYNHHVDMAAFKGRLFVAWDSCEKDEDVGVSRELYATSADGFKWSAPSELFPKGISTALRMYFFRAPNGRMLAIAGLRTSPDTTAESKKGGLVVLEILKENSLGEVYTLRNPSETNEVKLPTFFSKAGDLGFVEACDQLLKNKPFLEQQDYGRLLGERKMKWHDLNAWPADEPSRAEFPNRFGKAICFYHRADGALVGLMKWGWVTFSRDEGETWSSPTRPASLVAGMAKVWGQRTPNGKYALFYNPHLLNRFPLIMVHGDDGITFRDMRIVNGERPPIRFPGLYKVEGPQYVRGISEWSTDGSWKDDAVWIVYSMN